MFTPTAAFIGFMVFVYGGSRTFIKADFQHAKEMMLLGFLIVMVAFIGPPLFAATVWFLKDFLN